MTFSEFYKTFKYKSDKGTKHDYIDGFYSPEFTNKKLNNLNILEIGINKGYSLCLFAEWFINSNITGIDVVNPNYYSVINEYKNIKSFNQNAYSKNFADTFENNTFDYIIDDGPHTLESQIQSVQLYLPKVKQGGKLIIEDVNNIDQTKITFESLNVPFDIIDLRKNKNRYDDVLLVFKYPEKEKLYNV